MGGLKEQFYTCFCCGGDGKETCTNPDHGFISDMGGETGRLGCPVCGHHPDHKVPNGGDCECCEGKGYMTLKIWSYWAYKYGYDIDDPIEYEQFVYVPSERIEQLEKRLDLMIDNLRLKNRINGANLLQNGFITGEYLNISPGLKKHAKSVLYKEIENITFSDRVDLAANQWNIYSIECKHLNKF